MAKKKTKSFLPKRVAGVKVPKSVRKGRFGELLASPTGQALVAEAILRRREEAGEVPVGVEAVAKSPAPDGGGPKETPSETRWPELPSARAEPGAPA